METKLCKYCQTEIPKKATVCPNCKKKLKNTKGIVIGAVIAFFIIVALATPKNNDAQKVGEVEKTSAEPQKVGEVNETNNTVISDTQSQEEPSFFTVGDIVETENVKLSFLSAEIYEPESSLMNAPEGKVYYKFEFEFENLGKSDMYISAIDFDCYADGYVCESELIAGKDCLYGETVSAGRKLKGNIYFEIPKDVKKIELEYKGNYFSNKKTLFVIEL